MKVILTRDVARLGRKSEICEVPTGHALNFLIPRKMAVPATPENLRRQKESSRQTEMTTQKADEAFTQLLKKLEGNTIQHRMDANEKGHLYQGLKATDVAQIMKEQGYKIAVSSIHLHEPIKNTGNYTIPLKHGSHEGVVAFVISKK